MIIAYLCSRKAVSRSVAGINCLCLYGEGEGYKRKVRAVEDAPLLKVEAVGDDWIWKKKTTALLGKGEKVV